MSIHIYLDGQIEQLKKIGDVEAKRQRLGQLPVFTQSLNSTRQQANYLSVCIALIQVLFQRNPEFSQADIQYHLQKPTQILKTPQSVLTASQSELNEFQTSLADCREHLQESAKILERQLMDIKNSFSKEIDSVYGLLKIPDLLSDNTEQEEIQNTLTKMRDMLPETDAILNKAKRSRVPSNPAEFILSPSIKWRNLYGKFSTFRDQLSFDRLQQPPYSLSEETISIIRALIEGQQITLRQISPQIMTELQTNFEQFLNQVELRFKS